MEVSAPNILNFITGTLESRFSQVAYVFQWSGGIEPFRKNIFTIEYCRNSIHFGGKITYILPSIIAQYMFFLLLMIWGLHYHLLLSTRRQSNIICCMTK